MKQKLITSILFVLIFSMQTINAQPIIVQQIPIGSYNFFESLGSLYFFDKDSLWKSNGTAGGTTFVKDLNGWRGIQLSEEGYQVGTTFFFITQNSSSYRLWRSNGSSAGTSSVAVYTKIEPLAVFNNEFYYGAMDGSTPKLFKVGLGAPVFLKSLNVFPDLGLEVRDAAVVDGYLAFAVYPAGALELWRTNGTPAGTVKIKDFPPSSIYSEVLDEFTVVNNTLYFSNRTDFSLWKSNGTAAGTTRVGGNADALIGYQGQLLYFERVDMDDVYLMITDGTEAGTRIIKRLNIGDAGINEIGLVNNLVFFTLVQRGGGDPITLYRTDATSAGTFDLASFDSDNYDFTIAGNHLFWLDDGVLWQSDLSPSNTRTVAEIFPGISINHADNLINVSNTLFFTTFNANDLSLWKYNPNAPATNTPFFTVIDAATDKDQAWLREGDTIVKYSGDLINIRFNSIVNPGSVRFRLNGSVYRTENEPPFALAGDNSSDYNAWIPSSQGNYTLIAQQYSGNGATGSLLTSNTIHFYVKVINLSQPPIVSAGPDKSITLPVNQVTLTGTASDPDGSIASVRWRFISGPSTLGNLVIFSPESLSTIIELYEAGLHRFRLEATDNMGVTSYDDIIVSVIEQAGAFVSSFTLINADTDQDIMTLTNGSSLNLASLPTQNLNVRANIANGTAGSVRFQFDALVRTENTSPFSLFGDDLGNYKGETFTNGNHTLSARAYSGVNASGTATGPYTISFFVSNNAARMGNVGFSEVKILSYPNPSSDYFDITVCNEGGTFAEVEVYDPSGKLMDKLFEGNVRKNEELKIRWNARAYLRGVYFLKINISDTMYIEKLVLN